MIQKFRVWVKPEKRMIETSDILSIDLEYEEVQTQKVYFVDGLPDDRDLENFSFENVILMQSTGLKDKNGDEIFEGDILCDEGLEQEDEFVYVTVSYREGMWVCEQITDEPCGYGGALNEFSNDYSIIGNIYKNPELLEVV